MLLAAGRGERMRPLTDCTPKPLLQVAGRALIERQLLALRAVGVREVVVNSAHLGAQIRDYLGDGHRWGLHISHSPEPPGALDTGGGIRQALPLLGTRPFLVVNSDIWTNFSFQLQPLGHDDLAHLVMVPNPPHNPDGDFGLLGDRVRPAAQPRLTYSGIALLRPELLASSAPGKFPLAPLLRAAAEDGRVSGELHCGSWIDVGTPERLTQLRRQLGAG